MKYSKFFTKDELLYSKVAKKLNINQYEVLNKLPSCIEDNLKCLSWFLTAVRCSYNHGAIYVSSGFRSRLLNQCIGGARHSFHLIGAAADIFVEHSRLADLFNHIKLNYPCEELYINYTQNYIHVVPKNLNAYGKRKEKTST